MLAAAVLDDLVFITFQKSLGDPESTVLQYPLTDSDVSAVVAQIFYVFSSVAERGMFRLRKFPTPLVLQIS